MAINAAHTYTFPPRVSQHPTAMLQAYLAVISDEVYPVPGVYCRGAEIALL